MSPAVVADPSALRTGAWTMGSVLLFDAMFSGMRGVGYGASSFENGSGPGSGFDQGFDAGYDQGLDASGGDFGGGDYGGGFGLTSDMWPSTPDLTANTA